MKSDRSHAAFDDSGPPHLPSGFRGGEPLQCPMPIGGGDPAAAFEVLWRAELVRLRAFCRWRSEGDRGDAEDALGRTAERAWRAFGRLENRERFGAWVRQIAEHEVLRLARHRRTALLRSSAVFVEDLLDETSTEDCMTQHRSALVSEMVRAATQAHAISALEAQVVAARLQGHSDEWRAVASQLCMTADACAVHWSRALPKLRVFTMVARPALVGGTEAIRKAFEKARAATRQPLTPLEVEAFRHEIIERGLPRRRSGWRDAVRAAAAKVAYHLPSGILN